MISPAAAGDLEDLEDLEGGRRGRKSMICECFPRLLGHQTAPLWPLEVSSSSYHGPGDVGTAFRGLCGLWRRWIAVGGPEMVFSRYITIGRDRATNSRAVLHEQTCPPSKDLSSKSSSVEDGSGRGPPAEGMEESMGGRG